MWACWKLNLIKHQESPKIEMPSPWITSVSWFCNTVVKYARFAPICIMYVWTEVRDVKAGFRQWYFFNLSPDVINASSIATFWPVNGFLLILMCVRGSQTIWKRIGEWLRIGKISVTQSCEAIADHNLMMRLINMIISVMNMMVTGEALLIIMKFS